MSVNGKTKVTNVLGSMLLSVLCASCDMNGGKGMPDALVAAKVDGIIITKKSVEENAPVGDAMQQQRLLETFVTEQLFANAALKQNLHANEAALQGDEIAKRHALAKEYLVNKKSQFSRVSNEDIRAFYEKNPALFAQRRIYRLQEIAVKAPVDQVDKIIDQFANLKTFNKRTEWLKTQNIAYTTNVTVKPAEDLPADLLPALSVAVDGAAFNLQNADGMSSVQVTGIENSPLSLAQAQPDIELYLDNDRTKKMIEDETRRLRTTAKIQYFEPYLVLAQGNSK